MLSTLPPRLALLAVLSFQSTLSLALPAVKPRAVAVLLGEAITYGGIAATALTSTGATLIKGDAGTYPGTSITGFPPGEISGTTSAGGTEAQVAQAAILTAYNDAAGLVSTQAMVSADLGGLKLGPGVYTFPTLAASLSSTLTVDGSSDPKGQFVFQIRTTFSTAVGSKIELINGAQACNIYFVIGSSATIGGASELKGNFLAYTSIAVAEGASIQGTLGALNGAVTLIDNALTAQNSCST